jgi:Mce-associated membrane protein
MSTPTPGPSRRRRIAGERRTARPGTTTLGEPATEPTAEPTAAPTTERPLARSKAPRARRTRAPRPARRPSSGGWWGSRASLLVLSAVLLVAVLLTSLLALGLLGNRGIEDIRQADATDSAGLAATAAAERAATAILAYNASSLDSDQAAAARFMTPTFARKYDATFEKVVKPAAEESKAKVTAEVQGSSVVRAAPDRVRVLLFVDQTTVSTANEGPQKALNRVEMDMVERSGTWLVDNISSY